MDLEAAWKEFVSEKTKGKPEIALASPLFLHEFYCELMRSREITFYEGVRRLFNLGFRGPALTGLNWRISLR